MLWTVALPLSQRDHPMTTAVTVAATVRPLLDPEAFALDLWTSLPEDKPAKILQAMQGDSIPLANVLGKTLTVQHILAHRVELVDEETGEIDEGGRIVLLTTDGKQYACVSKGVLASLKAIMHYYGTPPWDKGLKLKVVQASTRGARRVFKLLPVE